MNIFQQIVFRARLHQDRPALATVDGVVNYFSLIKATEAAAEVLGTLPLNGSTLVLLDIKNQFHHLAMLLALGLRGIPSASIYSRLTVETSGVTASVLLTDAGMESVAGARAIPVTPQWFANDPALAPDYPALLAFPGFADEKALARIAFSSGTTGIPKAVGFRAGIVQKRIASASLLVGPGGLERTLSMVGFSVFGGYQVALGQLGRGGLLVLAGNIPDAVQLIRIFEVGYTVAATVQVIAMLKELQGRMPLTSLRTLNCGSSSFPVDLIKEAQRQLCSNIQIVYGSTEAGVLSVANSNLLDTRPNSVGYRLPHVELEVVDSEHRPLPAGETGIIRLKTDEMAEYVVPTSDTAEMFRDGWFYPGDVGSVDASGAVVLVGRSTEVINHNGIIVAPEWVEGVLARLPGVREVAVFGVPNATGQQDIWAAMVSDGFVDAVALTTAVAGVLKDRTPDRIIQVDELPRTETGKVRRGELRERLAPGQNASRSD